MSRRRLAPTSARSRRSRRLALALIPVLGVYTMLLVTAAVCIILGMGMPTAAVYIVLVSVIAPALIKMGYRPWPRLRGALRDPGVAAILDAAMAEEGKT